MFCWVVSVILLSGTYAGSLGGVIFDAQTGLAVPAALVVIYPDESSEVDLRNTTTNAMGEYRFEGLPASFYDVIVNALGYDEMAILNIPVGSGEEANLVQNIGLEESVKPSDELRFVLTWDGSSYDLDSQLFSSCGCRVYYDHPQCNFMDHPHTNIELLGDDKYGGNQNEEIIIFQNVTCGVYDYFVSIYTHGYSFDDTDAHVAIYNTSDMIVTEVDPRAGWSNSSQTFWWVARVVVGISGDIDIKDVNELQFPVYPEDTCWYTIPCGTFSGVSTQRVQASVFVLSIMAAVLLL